LILFYNKDIEHLAKLAFSPFRNPIFEKIGFLKLRVF